MISMEEQNELGKICKNTMSPDSECKEMQMTLSSLLRFPVQFISAEIFDQSEYRVLRR